MQIEPFRLERYFSEYEFAVPHLLCGSDCESFSVEELLQLEEGARESFANLRLGYTESRGDPQLRAEIASLYEHITAADILVHAGAEEAVFNFMNVILEPGQQIFVHAPCYQSLGEVGRAIGAETIAWKADPEADWEPNLQFLRARASSRTRAVVVNFPHNPTGYLPRRDFLDELSQLSDEHGFLVFSDEVYRGLEYDPADRLPSFCDLNERSVSIGVMSKTYGLAGLRIGWIATRNRALLEQLAAFKDYTTICSSAPSEFLSLLALRNRKRIVERNLGIIRANLDRLDAFFARHPGVLAWHRPRAGTIAFPRYLGESVEQFCEQLRQKAGVLLLPGTMYGPEYNCVRIGFGRRNLPSALQQFERYLTGSLKV